MRVLVAWILGSTGVFSLLCLKEFVAHEYLAIARFVGRLLVRIATFLIPQSERNYLRAECLAWLRDAPAPLCLSLYIAFVLCPRTWLRHHLKAGTRRRHRLRALLTAGSLAAAGVVTSITVLSSFMHPGAVSLAPGPDPGPLWTMRASGSRALSPDGRILASVGPDRTIILWDLTDRTHPARLSTLTGHTNQVDAVAFSPDGHTLASASLDGTARLWDVTDLAHPAYLAILTGGHTNQIDAVAFSPDARVLASASLDGTALWNVSDPAHPTRLSTLTGQTNQVDAVAFSPDARVLASASLDGTAWLWDVSDPAHPTRLSTLTGQTNQVASVAFSPDGGTLAITLLHGTTMLWDVTDPAHPTRRVIPIAT
jgi:hypothetical protein